MDHRKPTLLPLAVTCLAAAVLLTACKEPAEPVDFAPPAGADAAPSPAPRSAFNAPTELPTHMRAIAGSAGRCNLERVNGAMFADTPVKVSKGAMTSFGGWLADTDGKLVPDTFQLRFVNGPRAWGADVKPTIVRADVQKLLGGDAAFAKTGHSAEYDLSGLPDGTYRVYTAFKRVGTTYACDNGRAIVVGP